MGPLEIDWDTTIDRVLTAGRASVPKAVGASMLDRLLAVDLHWVDLDEQLPSGVYQQYRFAGLDPSTDSALSELCAEIHCGLGQLRSQAGLDRLVLNEAAFHQYRAGDAGLGRHRDRDFYHHLVIGVTLAGSGELHLFDDGDKGEDGPVEVWHTRPGDLYVFRAPGLEGCADGRPAHATGPTAGRTSLTLRHNVHGCGGGW